MKHADRYRNSKYCHSVNKWLFFGEHNISPNGSRREHDNDISLDILLKIAAKKQQKTTKNVIFMCK